MSKKTNIICGVISGICVVALVLWGINSNKEVSTQVSNEGEIGSSEVKEIEKPSEDSLNINNIPGFSNHISAIVTENNEQADNNIVDIGIKLPFNVPGTSMEIQSVGQYTGPFIEDGSDTPSANILSLVVKNNSDEMLQYGEIHMNVNNNTAIFKLSNLPAKTSALVIESTGNIEFSKDNTYEFVDSMYASISDVSLMEDKIEVNGGDNEITIKNISGEDLGTVYVYYKYIQEGGAYLGGITYRTKFENVTAGAEISEKTSHYSKTTSEILMVDYIK